jgi:hypothetical protein
MQTASRTLKNRFFIGLSPISICLPDGDVPPDVPTTLSLSHFGPALNSGFLLVALRFLL